MRFRDLDRQVSREADERISNLERALRQLCYGVLGTVDKDGRAVQVCVICRRPQNEPHSMGCMMANLFVGIEVQRPRLLMPFNGAPPKD